MPGRGGKPATSGGNATRASPQGAYRHTSGAEQCTHLFDLASLAIAHAARGTGQRLYDVTVEADNLRGELGPRGTVVVGQRRLRLCRNGDLVLDWQMDSNDITTGPYAGQNVRGMMRWIEASVTDLDQIEAVSIARRSLIVSTSLLYYLDKLPPDINQRLTARTGACYTYQPALISTLTRAMGSSRDFTTSPESLLADLNLSV